MLRVLEEKEIERVGDHKPIPVDVRIISASNKDLEAMIGDGLFREDLFFRINVFPLSCPPLAKRLEDIPPIVKNFIDQNRSKGAKEILGLTPEAMESLLAYPWPGNVRELRNAVEYAFVLCSGEWIGKEHLPPKIATIGKRLSANHAIGSMEERTDLIQTLRRVGGNQSEAARILGVSRVTIWKRIKKYGIDLNLELGRVAASQPAEPVACETLL